MVHNATFAKNLILAASLCCLLFVVAPTTADREVGLQSNYFQRLRNKRTSQSKYPRTDGQDQAAKTSVPPKRGTRASLLHRSFIVAAIFWTVRFLVPQIIRLISEFKELMAARAKERRRRPKEKSYRSEESVTTGGTVSISPSLREMMDSSDDEDDVDESDSSFVYSTSTFSSMSSFLTSFTKPRRRSKQSSVALTTKRSKSSANSTKRLKSRSAKTKHSKTSKRQTYVDEESRIEEGVTQTSSPNFLHLIDEENVNNGAVDEKLRKSNDSKHRRRKKNEKKNEDSQWLDDASLIPITGNVHREHVHYPKKHSTKSDSRLEKKLLAAAASSHHLDSNGNHTRQEKQKSSKSHHNQWHHRRRDSNK